MKAARTIFIISGVLIILILLAIRLGWFEGKDETEKEQKKTEVTVSRTETAQQKRSDKKPKTLRRKVVKNKQEKAQVRQKPTVQPEERELGVGDPFAYSNTGSGEFTPLSGNKQVGTITVKGIIRIDGESPKAILHLKDSDRVHYVSKDSVVRVSVKEKKGTLSSEAYIVVKDIRNDEVELIQLERPDKVIIIR